MGHMYTEFAADIGAKYRTHQTYLYRLQRSYKFPILVHVIESCRYGKADVVLEC